MRITVFFIVALLISGCGGGGGGPAPQVELGEDTGGADQRAALATLLNAYRSAAGLTTLTNDDRLVRAARLHNADMRTNGFFSHTGSTGQSASDRVEAAGFRWCFVAENIAQGQTSAAQVMTDWRNSPGHNKNMLTPNADQFGVHYDPDGHYWTLVLARGC